MTFPGTAFRGAAMAIAAFAMIASNPLFADEKKSNRTLRAGPDVWRVELHEADQLRHTSAGDSEKGRLGKEVKRNSEIRWVSWRLISGDQYHQSRLKGRELQAVGLGGRHKGTYVFLKKGETISARIPEGLNGRQLWVHAQQYNERDGRSTISFTLEIKVRELDCVRKRVCRRGGVGGYRISATLDVPPIRSQACVAENTIRLGTMVTDRRRPVFHPEGQPSNLTIGSNGEASPAGPLRMEYFKGGTGGSKPVVLPIIGTLEDVTICIASTT